MEGTDTGAVIGSTFELAKRSISSSKGFFAAAWGLEIGFAKPDENAETEIDASGGVTSSSSKSSKFSAFWPWATVSKALWAVTSSSALRKGDKRHLGVRKDTMRGEK